MTNEAFQQSCDNRKAVADEVLREPFRFHVCETCLSITERTRGLCPNCHAYRFNFNIENVIFAARIVFNTPYPLTEGTIPRF
jgi:hypothetical protein